MERKIPRYTIPVGASKLQAQSAVEQRCWESTTNLHKLAQLLFFSSQTLVVCSWYDEGREGS
jgi:hypothetical protein